MNRSLILVTAAAALALAACTSTPQSPKEDSPPAASNSAQPTSNPAPPVVTEVVTQTVTNPPAAPEKPVIGSFGYGKLKLGMSLQQARDTGLISRDEDDDPNAECSTHEILGTGERTWISKTQGVVTISFTPAMSSDGVGKGATEAKLKAEYTNLEPIGPNYSYVAKADNNPNATFVFGVVDGKLRQALLDLNGQRCHN
ncbi:hypothetical protein [Lentzea aerocolonigenes]|uniref:hypothetical protein n=1 Tax=Lentzea aerocolonigenes TaxID=68170 RepID=UPI0006974095|nr:hypothetical protein [Lentzea aerocolonigenes]